MSNSRKKTKIFGNAGSSEKEDKRINNRMFRRKESVINSEIEKCIPKGEPTYITEYIVNNFRDEFMALPFQDEVVFGLICNLVMHDAINFVGTSGSTYTAYIHRNRNKKGIETWDFFDNPPKATALTYSWNGYPLENGRKMWWREWSESKLNL